MTALANPTQFSARFDDFRAGRSLLFGSPTQVLLARHPAQVAGVLDAAQQAVESGRWVYGFVTFEAAPGLDPSLCVRGPESGEDHAGLPLAWFAVCDAPTDRPLATVENLAQAGGAGRPELSSEPAYRITPWELEWDRAQHASAVKQVKDAIARGETYQVNLTTRARALFSGDAHAFYLDLASRQRGAFCSYLEAQGWSLLSASPESFLEWHGGQLKSVPMKGTAQRGADAATDAALRQGLADSAKDAAENVMIVDLIRNDLARVAEVGSVHVPAIFSVEGYPTVWQLTSTVAATARAEVGLRDLMAAMFPCGSITGAPKKSTMDLIAQIEFSPRGIYCGAIGFIAPSDVAAEESEGGFTRSSRGSFSVAIRTVAVEGSTGRAEYGVGGGVTWQSTADGEYGELLAKTGVLHGGDDFGLIETFALTDAGPRHLERHLARMRRSAEALGFVYDAGAMASVLEDRLPAALANLPARTAAGPAATEPVGQEGLGQVPLLLGRLELRRDGTVSFGTRAPVLRQRPLRLGLDRPERQDTRFVVAWRRHKTTNRSDYDAARRRHPDCDDVVLVNGEGMVTETTVANLAALIDGQWITPPVHDGCLPGIGRQVALEQGLLRESSLTVAQLRGASKLAVLSSAMGWRAAQLAN